jgi:hypothetical protein
VLQDYPVARGLGSFREVIKGWATPQTLRLFALLFPAARSSLSHLRLVVIVTTQITKRTMATAVDDSKASGVLADDRKVEDVAEKDRISDGEVEANAEVLDEKAARKVLTKVDYRLVPILSLLYLVAFIDRSNSTFPSTS